MAGDDGTVHTPPRHLADKVPRHGGPSPETAIRRALDLAEDLVGDYQGWAADDLEKLWQRFQAGPTRRADIRAMFDMAHEIRGQGGTFGYPLISVIADSLCKLLEHREQLGDREIEAVKLHILAMKAVFRQGAESSQERLASDLGRMLAELRARAADAA